MKAKRIAKIELMRNSLCECVWVELNTEKMTKDEAIELLRTITNATHEELEKVTYATAFHNKTPYDIIKNGIDLPF